MLTSFREMCESCLPSSHLASVGGTSANATAARRRRALCSISFATVVVRPARMLARSAGGPGGCPASSALGRNLAGERLSDYLAVPHNEGVGAHLVDVVGGLCGPQEYAYSPSMDCCFILKAAPGFPNSAKIASNSGLIASVPLSGHPA